MNNFAIQLIAPGKWRVRINGTHLLISRPANEELADLLLLIFWEGDENVTADKIRSLVYMLI